MKTGSWPDIATAPIWQSWNNTIARAPRFFRGAYPDRACVPARIEKMRCRPIRRPAFFCVQALRIQKMRKEACAKEAFIL